jgi:hypothetical protein
MKVHGKVTRVVEAEGKIFFRPVDQEIYRKLALAQLTASGEIVVPAGDEKHAVGDEFEFEVLGLDDDSDKDAEETAEVPPRGDDAPKG